MARALSLIDDGLWPSAQLIVASAVALPAGPPPVPVSHVQKPLDIYVGSLEIKKKSARAPQQAAGLASGL